MYREAVSSLAILSPQAAKETVDKILALEQHWVCPNNDFFFTVGAFSAREFFDKDGPVSPERRDVYDRYNNIRASLNPVLMANFNDMYESVRSGLEGALGAKVLYANEHIGLPGFQILGPSPEQKFLPQEVAEQLEKLEGWSAFHIDTPYMPHASFWQRFQRADFNNALTFTLSLQLPKSGSGLDVWKNPGDTEAGVKFNGIHTSEHPALITDHEFVPYQTGHLTYFTGHMVHRVAGRHRLLRDDRRITLQGHGVKCDGIWYLYN
ncbi:MAG: hypothetical protein WCG12_15235 [Alcaligenaceae bacterium]